MKKIVIHRGGILSAGYDASCRWLEVEFETHRIMRVEGIGFEMANRFLHSDMPAHYWEEEIEENFRIHEISAKDSLLGKEEERASSSREGLKKLFGDL